MTTHFSGRSFGVLVRTAGEARLQQRPLLQSLLALILRASCLAVTANVVAVIKNAPKIRRLLLAKSKGKKVGGDLVEDAIVFRALLDDSHHCLKAGGVDAMRFKIQGD